MTKKYFHKLSKEDLDRLKRDKVGWKYIREHYSQPCWCTFPTALDFMFGCWELTDTFDGVSKIKSEDDCMGCEYHKFDLEKYEESKNGK